jgi:hypothetical protein
VGDRAENLGNLFMKMRYERASYESFIVEVMKVDRDIRWEVNFTPVMRHDQKFFKRKND